MKKNSIITSLLLTTLLSSCSLIGIGSVATQATYNNAFPEKWSEKATKEQQQEVKNKVMKLLEEEYKQPFKLESFEYKYEKHHETGGSINVREYGTYYFKIRAVDNPAIEIDFNINQQKTLKETIGSFKKRRLYKIYCGAFGSYWQDHKNDKDNQALEKTKKYCDDKGQKGQYDNFWTQ